MMGDAMFIFLDYELRLTQFIILTACIDLNTQKIEQKEKYENQIAELELKNEELDDEV
jgi:hypothetical protein